MVYYCFYHSPIPSSYCPISPLCSKFLGRVVYTCFIHFLTANSLFRIIFFYNLPSIFCFCFKVCTLYILHILLQVWPFPEVSTEMKTTELKTEQWRVSEAPMGRPLSGVLPLLSNRGWQLFWILCLSFPCFTLVWLHTHAMPTTHW